jgi:hypothetical protein
VDDSESSGSFPGFNIPKVSLRPWFERWKSGKKTYNDCLVLKIISGHCGVKVHLKRFSIVDGSMVPRRS